MDGKLLVTVVDDGSTPLVAWMTKNEVEQLEWQNGLLGLGLEIERHASVEVKDHNDVLIDLGREDAADAPRREDVMADLAYERHVDERMGI